MFLYGGYDGLDAASPPSDDMWVLAIPWFIWIKVYSGVASHGRRGHKCARTFGDQLMVVGGQALQTNVHTCLEGLIQIFNINELRWQDKHEPLVGANFTVPKKITSVLSGLYVPYCPLLSAYLGV